MNVKTVAATRRYGKLFPRRETMAARVLSLLALSLGAVSHAHAAKITVDNASGGSVFGACTLLDAVISANNDSVPPGSTCQAGHGADTIVFKSGITQIVFSQPANFLFPDALLVTDTLTIDGGAVTDSGVPKITLSRSAAPGTANFRLIDMMQNLTLKGLMLENGHLTGDGESFCGGAIRVASVNAVLNISDSVIRNNSTEGDFAVGGAVCGANGNWRHVTLTGNHTSGRQADGGAISAWGGGNQALNLDYSLVDGNYVSGVVSRGGGISTNQSIVLYGAGFVSMYGSVVSHNQALCDQCGGGGISGLGEMIASRIVNNETSGNGGGVYTDRGFATGGFLLRRPPSDLRPASTISGNRAQVAGGGIYFYAASGSPSLGKLSVHDNIAGGNGGGIYLSDATTLRASSVTISGNSSSGNGAGVFVQRGGCFEFGRVTISANQLLQGGQGAGLLHGGAAKGLCRHSLDLGLIYGNLGGKDIDTDSFIVGDEVTVTGSHNLLGSFSARVTAPADTIGCDPHLGALADNGGNVLTHALPAGSCALDQSPPDVLTYDDERGAGYLSIFGTGRDIGAYEVQQSLLVVSGACGQGNGGLFAAAPTLTVDLCASGFSGKVVADNSNLSWRWTCGTGTECSARMGSQQWTITPSTSGTGTIMPDTPQTIVDGGKAQFRVTAGTGYLFASYSYCGQTTDVDPDQDSVTLSSIHGDCSIVFNFEPLPIPQDGVCGSDNGKTLNATPAHLCDAGTSSVLGGSGPWQWSCTRVNFSGKTAACSAQAGAVVPTHIVTASAGAGGTIAPNGTQSVADGSALTFTVTADTGHAIAGVTGCGGHLANNTYTTAPITADCSVNATFALVNNPVNGVCGSDDGKTLAAPPANLCASGTPSTVQGSGPWTWMCQGSNGGGNASCSAQKTAALTQTFTALSLAPNPVGADQNVIAAVSVSESAPTARPAASLAAAAGGAVTVSGGGKSCSTTVVNGGASCSLRIDIPGAYAVTAIYAGDATHASSSDTRLLTVYATVNGTLFPAPALDRWALVLMLISLGGVVAYRRRLDRARQRCSP